MQYPGKWRETVDPFELPFQEFRILKILGYPHAGNDVFYVDGARREKRCRAFVKVERQQGADLSNEVKTILALPDDLSWKPRLLEYSLEKPAFLVTEEAPGQRLSVILEENRNLRSLDYMQTYGKTLAQLHSLAIHCAPVRHRRFFDLPEKAHFQTLGLGDAEKFLRNCGPDGKSECFVHGDFHYANLLWREKLVSAVLDYELSGWGIREFDMAWAVFLRPGQKFLASMEEVEQFLQGYSAEQKFSRRAFWFYYVLVGVHFCALGEMQYRTAAEQLIGQAMLAYQKQMQ